MEATLVERYLAFGLALGRHVEGLVDAYYGPPGPAQHAAESPPQDPRRLLAEGRRLLADLNGGEPIEPDGVEDAARRAWLAGQVRGLTTTARKLAGEQIDYADEVEWCYGVRPTRADQEDFAAAHRVIDEILPGSGSLIERRARWIESHQIDPDKLRPAVDSLCADLRERTRDLFGLPEGEAVHFELVRDKPWSGFNYYLGGLQSTVAINIDVPVLSTSVAHLVAHESYPGHHTEHTHKEVGLVRRRGLLEETVFLVGTPQCLLAEGLADLGLEVVVGRHPEDWVADHLKPIGIQYESEAVRALSDAGESLSKVRANAAFRLHEDGADPETVIDEVARWSLIPRGRAEQAVRFLTDPTWRAYITCYVEGLPLCRRFAGGDPRRFRRLLDEHLLPSDLATG